jgi:hypothetical protein
MSGATSRDAELVRRPIPKPMYRDPLFWGLPQQYLVLWLATLCSISIAVGNGTHFVLGMAAFAAGMALVHPRLARICEDDALAIDVAVHWLLHEHGFSMPHPGIWDPADAVRPSIPGV